MSHSIQVINQRQYSWLVGSLIAGGGLLTIQHELIRIGQMDAWFSYLVPTLYVLLVGYVLASLSRRFPGKNLYEINFLMFGRIAGAGVNLIILLHLWLVLMRDLRSFGKFIGTILLPNTPEEILILLFMVLLMFYGRTGIEVVARVNDLFFPFFFALLLALPFLLSNELHKQLIQPVLTIDPANFTRLSLLGSGWYADIIVAGSFMHTLWSHKQIHAAIRHGTMIASLLLTLMLFMEVIVFGPVVPGNLLYPTYSLIQQIHVTDFLDRVDLTILSIWYPILACKMILIYLGFLTCIVSFVKQRDYTLLSGPISLLLLLTTLLAFKSTTEVSSFGNFSSPILTLSYQPLLLVALLIAMRKHRPRDETQASGKRHNTPEQPEDASGQQQAANGGAQGAQQTDDPGGQHAANSDGQQEVAGQREEQAGSGQGGGPANRLKNRIDQIGLRRWMMTSNMMLAAAVIFIAAGMQFGRNYAIVGIICGSGYGAALVGAIVATHMEMTAAKRYTVRDTKASS